MADVLRAQVPGAAHSTLVPVRGVQAGYVLLTDAPLAADAARRLDDALCAAHHFGLARTLGQLAPTRVVTSPHAAQWLAEREQRRGLSWGDQKPVALHLHPADAPPASARVASYPVHLAFGTVWVFSAEAARRKGAWLVGFACYELGLAFEPKLAEGLVTDPTLPLFAFGAFDGPAPWVLGEEVEDAPVALGPLIPA